MGKYIVVARNADGAKVTDHDTKKAAHEHGMEMRRQGANVAVHEKAFADRFGLDPRGSSGGMGNKTGDTITGRARGGATTTATVGPSGKLIGKTTNDNGRMKASIAKVKANDPNKSNGTNFANAKTSAATALSEKADALSAKARSLGDKASFGTGDKAAAAKEASDAHKEASQAHAKAADANPARALEHSRRADAHASDSQYYRDEAGKFSSK